MNGHSERQPDPKIIDLLKKEPESKVAHVSLEYFPPRTEQGVKVRAATCNVSRNGGIV